jgi:predicted dehydrogenase
MNSVKLIIVGAGSRGSIYAKYAEHHPDQLQIVGVAEPRQFYRERMAATHHIPAERVFDDWRALARQPKLADAVVIATQDKMHTEPAVAFANLGYHILLEKPMAPTIEECHRITDAARANDVILAVGHVLRYTRYTQKVKEIVDSGALGDIVSIQRLEPVGYYHFAHSYVRGNWRNEAQSSFILLAKSCHDLDWIRYIMGERCVEVSSFGNLYHFRKENQPPNAADRCLDCEYEPNCPYSAKKIYLERVRQGETGWPANIITPDLTEAGVMKALREGPYGRCVYACDNDVPDHQVVNMLFESGKTASFTMIAFTEVTHRRTRIFGTRGYLEGNGETLQVLDFLTDEVRTIETSAPSDDALSGHGGGDYYLMKHFVEAVATNDPGKILSGPDESLESHLMVFAAEQARRRGSVEKLADYWSQSSS